MKWKSYDKSNKMIEGLKWWEREREREQQMILVASQAAEKSRAIAFA